MKSKKSFFILGFIALTLIAWFVSAHNRFVTLQGEIDGLWAQIENNLQRRYDLIPNLVATVQGYAQHEEDVFLEIAQARAQLAGANNISESAQASQNMENALGRLLAIAESYPELKANQNFMDLQTELAGTENRLATSRRDYNNKVKDYNITIKKIPNNLVANLMGLTARAFFEIETQAHQNVKVDFSR